MRTIPFLPSVVAGICLLASAGCTVHEHSHSRAPGYTTTTYYEYDYYPAFNVYYYPRSRVYYWNDRGRWSSGHRLPPHYEIRDAQREQLRLHSRKPWMEHGPDRH